MSGADRFSEIFHGAGPRVFTLPPAAGFLGALARTLLDAFPDPEALAGVTLLVPTRRAGRALGEAFAAARGQDGAAILPMIRPIGDVDADDPPFEPGELADAAPPAISAARRRFELAALILAKETATGRSMGAGGALALADDLAGLIDDMATEEVTDLSALDADIRAALPAHMQEAAIFLDIVLDAWPKRLADLGAVDPARRRSLLLRALAAKWRDTPPDGPVIATGSTGSIPAAAELLGVVANLPLGAVVLPGFQRDMDDRGWDAIDDTHPQLAMKDLVETMALDRSDVRVWPGAAEGRSAGARARVIAEALRPAEATADWLGRVGILKDEWGADVFEAGLSGLSAIEAPAPADEARAVALALRETLETPGRTAVVVTPDRGLARRIATEMRRYGVTLDDSAGEALSDTAAGAFLMRVLDAALDPGSALALTALWASPLFSMGEERAKLRGDLGAMERAALRGRRPGRSFADVAARIAEAHERHDEAKPRWRAIIETIEAGLSPLLALEGEHPAAAWASALAQAAEALAAGPEQPGPERLWAGEAGESASGLIREFIEESKALRPMAGHEFARALLETARSRRVRPRFGAHPRLQILGPLEARLISADRVILAGLNEGVWPAKPKIDPFLSRDMRRKAGLSAPERRFGLAAHDFAELACQPEVILTRSAKVEGAPAPASRWVWRLQTLARGALGEEAARLLDPPTDYLSIAARLDHSEARSTIAPPEPRPPVAARPRTLSVTRIETWIRDPYAIYARSILRLDALDPLDQAPGGRERGNAYHRAFELWLERFNARDLPDGAEDHLVALGRDCLLEAGFSEAELGAELPRFRRVAAWLAGWERGRRRDKILPVAWERSGAITFGAPGGAFTLTAKADRFDAGPDGIDLIDYKTGSPPSAKAVAAGFSPQLPLQAAMLAEGGFEGVTPGDVRDLIYLRVGGQKTAAEHRSAVGKDDTAAELAGKALDDLRKWVAEFDDPGRSYPSQPRAQFTNAFGDYDHLARRGEWASAPGGDGGGEGNGE